MNGSWLARTAVVGTLGITMLLGAPLLAQADQGKWWKPKEGSRNTERGDRDTRGDVRFHDGRYSGRRSWGGYSTWRGMRVRRDFLIIRDRRYGGYLRARRFYCAPRYHGRFVYVRPVRFFIAADARIGGLNIRARIGRPHYLYGCNFCDERFDTYDAYAAHVAQCDHRPDGCQISVSNWDDGYDSYQDGPYRADDGDRYDSGNGFHDGGDYDQGSHE